MPTPRLHLAVHAGTAIGSTPTPNPDPSPNPNPNPNPDPNPHPNPNPNQDVAACRAVLPSLISALSWQLGDEESAAHRVALATMHKLLQPEGGDDKNAESKHTEALCAACEASLSVVLRSS